MQSASAPPCPPDSCLAGIANTIARAAGKKAQIVHYDPKSIADLPKGAFPFRAVHFFASPDKAKRLLSWAPNHNFVDDVEQRVRRKGGRQADRGRRPGVPATARDCGCPPCLSLRAWPGRRPLDGAQAPPPGPRQRCVAPCLLPLPARSQVWEYIRSGRLDKQIDFSSDDLILAAAGKVRRQDEATRRRWPRARAALF